MSLIEQLERQIAELNPSELGTLREWFDRYDAGVWDRQIEADAKSGKLSRLVECSEITRRGARPSCDAPRSA